MGLDSPVVIAPRYGLDCPGIESRWQARFSPPVQTGPGTHPTCYTIGTGSFPGVKRPGRGVDHPPHLAPRLKKEYNYTSTPFWAFVTCSMVYYSDQRPFEEFAVPYASREIPRPSIHARPKALATEPHTEPHHSSAHLHNSFLEHKRSYHPSTPRSLNLPSTHCRILCDSEMRRSP